MWNSLPPALFIVNVNCMLVDLLLLYLSLIVIIVSCLLLLLFCNCYYCIVFTASLYCVYIHVFFVYVYCIGRALLKTSLLTDAVFPLNSLKHYLIRSLTVKRLENWLYFITSKWIIATGYKINR